MRSAFRRMIGATAGSMSVWFQLLISIETTTSRLLHAASSREWRGTAPAHKVPVGPRTCIEHARRCVLQNFAIFVNANNAAQREQVIWRTIGHHVRQEMHGIGECVQRFLKPHNACRDGE